MEGEESHEREEREIEERKGKQTYEDWRGVEEGKERELKRIERLTLNDKKKWKLQEIKLNLEKKVK